MILDRLEITPEELERRTGWRIEARGACKGDRCVPLPPEDDSQLDVRMLADRLGMALVHDSKHGLWALGPESEGHVLASTELPEITLADRHGKPFDLSSLRGSKVLLVAWASW
jgi:hypothetical protein